MGTFKIAINLLMLYSVIIILNVLPITTKKPDPSANNSRPARNVTTRIMMAKSFKYFNVAKYPPLVFPTNDTKQMGTIIFLHSHNQQSNAWYDEIMSIREPYMKVICPQANEFPVTYHVRRLMTSWFDFDGEEFPTIQDNATGMENSTDYIHYLIDEEVKTGIPANKIILAGYCQGGAMALQAGLTFHDKLGGIVTFNTLKPMNKTFASVNESNINIPILHSYLWKAPFLSAADSNITAANIKNISKNAIYKVYHGKQYVTQQGLDDAKAFCIKYIMTLSDPTSNSTAHSKSNSTKKQ